MYPSISVTRGGQRCDCHKEPAGVGIQMIHVARYPSNKQPGSRQGAWQPGWEGHIAPDRITDCGVVADGCACCGQSAPMQIRANFEPQVRSLPDWLLPLTHPIYCPWIVACAASIPLFRLQTRWVGPSRLHVVLLLGLHRDSLSGVHVMTRPGKVIPSSTRNGSVHGRDCSPYDDPISGPLPRHDLAPPPPPPRPPPLTDNLDIVATSKRWSSRAGWTAISNPSKHPCLA